MRLRMYKNTIRMSFEAAHRLYRFRGKCNNIHGHSYKLEVDVASAVLAPCKRTPPGMIINFDVLKKIIQEEIIEFFDHKLILATGDHLANHLLKFEEHQKVMVLPEKFYDATSECMAHYFYDLLIAKGLEKTWRIKISAVRVSETEDTWSEFMPL